MSRRRVSRFTAVAAALAAATAGLVVGLPASAAPPLVVSLTFDDGLSSQHRLLPLLAEHQSYPAGSVGEADAAVVDLTDRVSPYWLAWACKMECAGFRVVERGPKHGRTIGTDVSDDPDDRQAARQRWRIYQTAGHAPQSHDLSRKTPGA